MSEKIFSGLSLRGYDFSNQDLTKADFRRADLSGCSFKATDLRGAIFIKCQLVNTDFSGAILDNTTFELSDVETACFIGAKWYGQVITKAPVLIQDEKIWAAHFGVFVQLGCTQETPGAFLNMDRTERIRRYKSYDIERWWKLHSSKL